jgi:hypothetical protein
MKLKLLYRSLLIMIPVGMICWQVYASNFQHLSKWRGGGYGMYTDSHPEHRSIVLKTIDTTIIIYPITKEHLGSMPESEKQLYKSSIKTLKLAALYPEYYKEQLINSPWVKKHQLPEATIQFYESYVDLEKRELYPHLIHSYE